MAQQIKKIVLKKEYGKLQRIAIAEEIINFIIRRTKAGKNIKGEKWKGKAGKYSKQYIDSHEFKVAGKNPNKVNLKLSSDMLDALKLIKEKDGEILIGYKNGTPENDKAEGNILGTYGQSSPIRGKKRNFLGISRDDLNKILKKYPVNPTKKSDIERLMQSAQASELTKEMTEGNFKKVAAELTENITDEISKYTDDYINMLIRKSKNGSN